MNMTTELARELQAILASPDLLLQAINERLAQIRILTDRWAEISTDRLSKQIPETVERIGATSSGIEYLPSGMTSPRADGAVRIRVWDEAIARALVSPNAATQRWGAVNAARPWIMVQDTLTAPGVTKDQKRGVGTNCANARMINGLAGSAVKGFAWPAYKVTIVAGIPQLGDEIADATAFNDDRVTLDGQVLSRGWWAADAATLAERSLAHFILTSGSATQPYSPGVFVDPNRPR